MEPSLPRIQNPRSSGFNQSRGEKENGGPEIHRARRKLPPRSVTGLRGLEVKLQLELNQAR